MGTQEAISNIIPFPVGGRDNINNVWHCMTRLRFDLIDDDKVDEIKKLHRRAGCAVAKRPVPDSDWSQSDQLVRTTARHVGESAGAYGRAGKARKSLVSMFMDTVSGVFGPIVPAIAGAGMIKGLLAGLIALKVVSAKSDTVVIIDLIASGVFYFLPFSSPYRQRKSSKPTSILPQRLPLA